MNTQDLLASVSSSLCASGLDISKTLQVGWYNQSVAVEHRLGDFDKPDSLAFLIGNTRKIWPPFLAWLAHQHHRLELANPLESYVEMVIDQAFKGFDAPFQIRFSHRAEPYHVAFQQLAEVAGLAWRSPAHLSIHPLYGCWMALRAVVVIDLPGPRGEAPGMAPVCGDCSSGCLPRVNSVLGKNRQTLPGHHDVAASWQDWLAIRDACPIGRDYRYSNDQIRYHYIKDHGFLASLVGTGTGTG